MSHREEVVLNDLRRIQRATDASLPARRSSKETVCLTRRRCMACSPQDGFTYPTASGSPDRRCSLIVDAVPLTIPNDIAVPLVFIVNELLTNAIQHLQPADEDRVVHVAVRSRSDDFSVTVSDAGGRPRSRANHFRATRPVDALTRQINATITKQNLAGSYTVTVTVPVTSQRSERRARELASSLIDPPRYRETAYCVKYMRC